MIVQTYEVTVSTKTGTSPDWVELAIYEFIMNRAAHPEVSVVVKEITPCKEGVKE